MSIKIGFISDLHTKQNDWYDNLVTFSMWGYEPEKKWKELDLLIFSGDCSSRGSEYDVDVFMNWFSLQPAKEKVMIAGNHDFFFDVDSRIKKEYYRTRDDIQSSIDRIVSSYPNIHYLNDSGVELFGLNIWGSPITPWFHDWAFNRMRSNSEYITNGIKQHWDKIPTNTDILITHGPPYGFGDLLNPKFRRTNEDPNVGCKDLLEKIESIKPKINVFGHIHEGHGVYKTDETTYINASCLDHNYSPINPPIYIEL